MNVSHFRFTFLENEREIFRCNILILCFITMSKFVLSSFLSFFIGLSCSTGLEFAGTSGVILPSNSPLALQPTQCDFGDTCLGVSAVFVITGTSVQGLF